ncbi:MAG: PfkB family carbohydrate kinase, partial [Verrucomicrobiales bacterium]
MTSDDRRGLLAGGNFIIDYVKMIDAYPGQDMLASILSESSANGGGPYNVLVDLASMGAEFPLEAAGLVGDDANGQWIFEDCRARGIDTSRLRRTGQAPTSY